MTDYALYLESGPRRRKTQVHVLDLLGCIAEGPTTEDALEAAPEAILAYLRFLYSHGEEVDPQAGFNTYVVIHVMEGSWIGQGDPDPGFAPDFEPLSVRDLETYRRRFEWLGADLLALARDLPRETRAAAPDKGRSIDHILSHVGGAQCAYLRTTVGKVDGLAAAFKVMESGSPDEVISALEQIWEISQARLTVLTDQERTQVVQHGQKTWTARRALRRMLEHGWEHLREISRRVDPSAQ